jgi:hypothetical protein
MLRLLARFEHDRVLFGTSHAAMWWSFVKIWPQIRDARWSVEAELTAAPRLHLNILLSYGVCMENLLMPTIV